MTLYETLDRFERTHIKDTLKGNSECDGDDDDDNAM